MLVRTVCPRLQPYKESGRRESSSFPFSRWDSSIEREVVERSSFIIETMSACPKVEREEGDHALQTAWTFWYDKKQSKKTDTTEFKGQLQKIASFDSVEGFWKLYCHLKRPSVLENNVNFHLFREGPNNMPMWEAYPRGGCWILKIKKRKDSGASVLGKMWQDIVCAAVGEAFEEPDVVGISLCIRRNEDLLSVWNVDNRNDEIRFRIGEKMKKILDLEPSTIIEYKHHAESMQDMSTFRNAKAYVFAASETPPPVA